MRRAVLPLLLVLLGMALGGCWGQRTRTEELSPEQIFELARRAVDKYDYERAQTLLDQLRDEHPFSKFAVDAELLAADMKFRQDLYEEAAAAYRSFEELHPTHPRAAYAMFRRGMAYLELIHSPDRDQTPSRHAAEAFQKLLYAHPDSEYAPEARAHLTQVRARLAAHELYVARYYLRKERYDAALARLQGLVRDYPDTPQRDEALRLALEVQDRKAATQPEQ
ncbi:MAG: outer membrane protein assembly factor BamD [Deferrisomatales bacterium]